MPDLLSFGVPYTLQTNIPYALPAAEANLFCGDATPTLEQSNISTFATKVAVTVTNGSATLSGRFIRATAGTPLITLARD